MSRPLLLALALILGALAILYAPTAQADGKVYVEFGYGGSYPYYDQAYPYYGDRHGHRGRGHRQRDVVWIEGHWAWDGYRHVWVEGYSAPVHRGYRHGSRYRYAPRYHYAPPYPRHYGPDLRFRVGYRD